MIARYIPLAGLVSALGVALGLSACGAAPERPAATLEEAFLKPPDESKPHTLWHWMNGHVTKEGITRDLEAMKEAGLGGFMLWNASEGIPRGPVVYMSPEWWELFGHTLDEAERLGLEMSVFNCGGWSSSGGPWVTPERAMQEVVWTEQRVTGPAQFDEVLEMPEPALGIERDMKRDPEVNKRYYVPREQVRGHYHDLKVVAFPAATGTRDDEPWRLKNWREKAGFAKFKTDWQPDGREAPEDVIFPQDRMVDLTSQLDAEGRLQWDVPPGEWIVRRIGYQPTGRQNHPAPVEGTGLEIDKHTAGAVDFHWDNSIAKMVAMAGDRTGSVLRGVHIDSFEVGHQNWSEGLPEVFRAEHGYDIMPFLPALTGEVVGSAAQTEDFLWDFRKTLSDAVVRNYYGRFAERCRENNLLFLCEPYGHFGNTDDFSVASVPDIPMCEWWAFRERPYHTVTGKLASSAAHTRGRRIVDAEAFTGDPERIFEEHPASMKAQGDFFFCQGVNRFSFHTFAHDPYDAEPGLGLGSYGSRIDRRNTWWPFASGYFEYVSRCQHLLQQGEPVADFLYFTGEDAPRQAKLRADLVPPPPEGYDFNFGDPGALMDLEVRDGRLVLPSGMSYRVLVLPPDSRWRLPAMRKIATLVEQGAVVVGPKPGRPPGLSGGEAARAEFARLADEVWGDCDGASVTSHAYGRGRVFWGEDLEKIAATLQMVPDFRFEAPGQDLSGPTQYGGSGIEYIHRRDGDLDLYFVSNQHSQPKTIEAVFRVAGRQPELWHPDSGQIEDAAVFRETADGRTAVTLDLDQAGSVFVVFRRPLPGRSVDALASDLGAAKVRRLGDRTVLESPEPGRFSLTWTDGEKQEVEVADGLPPVAIIGPWTVGFPPERGAPAEIILDELACLSTHEDPGVRFFSGTATYRTSFDLPALPEGKDWSALLELGDVQVIASVRLNGRDMGPIWKRPFDVDVTDALRAGRNDLEVRVANLWVNRLVGDREHPDDSEWTTDTRSTAKGEGLAALPEWVASGGPRPSPQRVGFVAWRWPHLVTTQEPLPAGLLGPVRLVFHVRMPLDAAQNR